MPYYTSYRQWLNKPGKLKAELVFHEIDAFGFYDHMVEPILVQRWWAPKVCKLDWKVGGEYNFEWPSESRRLSGKYTKAIGGELLEFTLQWENFLTPIQRKVSITVENSWNSQGCFVDLSLEPFGATNQEDWLKEDFGRYLHVTFNKLADHWHHHYKS